MAGTFQRAGVNVLRRATAAGLGGLTFALFVGVMAFAFTTSPAGDGEQHRTTYLTTASRIVELGTISMPPAGRMLDVLSEAVGANLPEDRRLELTTIEPGHVDLVLTRALARESRVRASSMTSAPVAGDSTADGAPPAPEPAAPAAEVAAAAVTEPALQPGDVVQATVSFYYCERGSQARPAGDGGGFCGVMRDGSVVYPGAAACAYAYLGQRFRIVGDPLERVYVCADTGSAVHGLHRDVWFMSSDEGWEWQREVGQATAIEILP